MSSSSCSKAAGEAVGEGGGLGERLGAPPAADDDRAEAGQLERRLAAEAGSGAGDDADLAVEQAVPEDPRGNARCSAPIRRAAYICAFAPGNLGRG